MKPPLSLDDLVAGPGVLSLDPKEQLARIGKARELEPPAPAEEEPEGRRAALRAELRRTVEELVVGEPLNDGLATRVETALKAVLKRHDLGAARVRVTAGRSDLDVSIELPEEAPRVDDVRIHFE